MASGGVAYCCRPVYSPFKVSNHIQAVVPMSNILMNRTRSKILRFLVRNGPSTCDDISSQLQSSPTAIRHHLGLLHSAELVERVSANKFQARPEEVRAQLEALAAVFAGDVVATGSLIPID